MSINAPYLSTNDAADPCALCVSWVHPDGDAADMLNIDEMEPHGPDGLVVPRLFNGVHASCQDAVFEYEATRSDA